MNVNGSIITLDVPAQTIGGRTLIPLRALVEALGKQVFWDDRGLILISDAAVSYDATTIDKIIDLLDIRVQADGSVIISGAEKNSGTLHTPCPCPPGRDLHPQIRLS